jgi:hypothetical protein
VGLKSLKSLNLTNGYPNNKNNKKKNNKVKSKPLDLFELAGNKNYLLKNKSTYHASIVPYHKTLFVKLQ